MVTQAQFCGGLRPDFQANWPLGEFLGQKAPSTTASFSYNAGLSNPLNP